MMVQHLERLHSFLIQGQSSECHVFEAVSRCSGGKVLKNCQHQVQSNTDAIIDHCYHNDYRLFQLPNSRRVHMIT